MRGDRVVPITCPARNTWAKPGFSIESSGLGGRFRAGCFHRPHIHIKQSVALVALALILLPQLDDFLEDFHIKALSLGLRKDFLFRLVQILQFGVQVLDPLYERTDPSAGNSDVRYGASLLNEIVKMNAKK
jgi:hypothetical protein